MYLNTLRKFLEIRAVAHFSKVFILTFAFLFLTLSCADLQQIQGQIPKPEVTIEKVEIVRISLQDVTLKFHTGIKNPYPMKLKLNSIDLDFKIESNRLLKTTAGRGIEIPARKKGKAEFDVTLKYTDVARIVKDMQNRDYVTSTIDAKVNIPLPKLAGLPPEISFDFKLEKKIPVISPRVTVANFNVKMPTVDEVKDSLTGAVTKSYTPEKVYSIFNSVVTGQKPQIIPEELKELDIQFGVSFDIILENKTRFQLDFSRVEYVFNVNNYKLLTGDTKDVIRSGNRTLLKINNTFSAKNLSAAVVNAFKSGKGNFQLIGSTKINLPADLSSGDVMLNFDETGSFNLR